MSSKTITECQSCGSANLILRFNAGYLPSVNVMQPIGQRLNGQNFYPAELLECQECKLVQLGCIVDQEEVFPPDYAYTSGSTRLLRKNFADLAKEARDYLADGDLIVSIGENDGTLLQNFVSLLPMGYQYNLLAIEPTDTAKVCRSRGIETWQLFFHAGVAKTIVSMKKKAKLITCCNCFAHMPNINGVMEGINHLLADDGVFIIEVQYLPKTLEKVQYDCFYAEHQFYYSIHSLKNLLERHGFVIAKGVKMIPTHGGSIRVTARKRQTIEGSMGYISDAPNSKDWGEFRTKVASARCEIWRLLGDLKRKEECIYGIGAPSRATTYLHYVGLDETILDCVCEIKGSNKIGKYIPGTAIPVVDEEKLYQDQPEYALLLSWHLADELIPKIREKGYSGRYIVPLPEVKVIE